MKAKWEGAFSVVLAVTLIFSIEYYYYAACSWYGPEEQARETINMAAIPVSHSSIHVPVRLHQETQENLFPKQTSQNRKDKCRCVR